MANWIGNDFRNFSWKPSPDGPDRMGIFIEKQHACPCQYLQTKPWRLVIVDTTWGAVI